MGGCGNKKVAIAKNRRTNVGKSFSVSKGMGVLLGDNLGTQISGFQGEGIKSEKNLDKLRSDLGKLTMLSMKKKKYISL